MPLVEAVKREGRRVFVWFVSDGLSDAFIRATDSYQDIGVILLADSIQVS